MPRFVAAVALVLVCATATWAVTPTDSLRQVFAQADRILTDPETEDRPMDRLIAIRKLINDALDFRETAALALGRHWATATPAEQAEFTELLADMLERSYIARLASQASLENGARIEYLSESVNGGDARVATTVARRNGGKIYLDYRMIDRDGRWKVRDVTVDGVSVAANYRSQIERVLQQGSLADLLAQMRDNVGRVEPSLRAVLAGEVAPADSDFVVELFPRKRPASSEPEPEAVAETAVPAGPPSIAVADKVVPTESVADAVVETIAPTGSEWTVAMAPADPAESVVVAETTPAPEPLAPPEPPAPVEPPASVAAADTAAPADTVAPADTATVAATPTADTTVPEPPAAETRVAALAQPPAPVEAPRVVVPAAPSRSAPLVTKAYWLRLGTVEAVEASGRLGSLLEERKLVVAVDPDLTPPALGIRLGPFTDATEAVMKLLELQRKGHDPSLVAERE